MILYHRTDGASARQIIAAGVFVSKEQPPYVYLSNRRYGQAQGYGDAVVRVRIHAKHLHLDDEFPSGERHYRTLVDVINRYGAIQTVAD